MTIYKGEIIDYDIIINEVQRAYLLEVLKTHLPKGQTEFLDGHPMAYWIGMLTTLPVDEKKYPGIQHGLCL